MIKKAKDRRSMMFWKYVLIFVAMTANVFATPQEEMFLFNNNSSAEKNKHPLFISLGGTCHVAIALRALGLRDAAYPLDWIISINHKAFLHVLRDNFSHYTDPNFFTTYQGVPRNLNWFYNLSFPHDFSVIDESLGRDKALEEWDSFKERYDRRIERFQELGKFPGKVYFFRSMWPPIHDVINAEVQENSLRARETRDTLAALFPNLDFTLVIISHPDLNIPVLEDIPNVVEFRIGRTHAELYEKIMLLTFEDSLAFGNVAAYQEPKFTPKAKSPIKQFFFERRGDGLYFCATFSRRSKRAVALLEKSGFSVKKNRKGKSYGSFATKDPKLQLKLLKLAQTQGAIPSSIYPELVHKINQG